MSPLFQLVYSTAHSLDESLIPTGFIELFIPLAALIWSHFLFNNWFYSTFYSDGRPYLVALFIQQLVLFNFLFGWPPLFGRTFLFNNWFYSTTVLFNCLFTVPYSNCFIQLIQLEWPPYLVFFSFFFSFFFKGVLPWDSNPGPLNLQSGCLPLSHHPTHHRHLFIHLFIFQLFFFFFFFGKKRRLT